MMVYSGGANGVDSIVEDIMIKKHIPYRFFSFEEHHTFCSSKYILKLTDQQLKEGEACIYKVSNIIHRIYPTQNTYTNKLLLRNYHIIKNAYMVFAFGLIEHNHVKGGTGWGVCIADVLNINVFFFDIQKQLWFMYHKKQFIPIDNVIFNKEKPIAIIGTRETDGYELIIREEIEKIVSQ